MRSRGGFSRGPDEPTPAELRAPNLWLLDYREGGTFCVLDPAVLMLWRPNMQGDTALEIESGGKKTTRSEEHTSELQSLMRISYAVFCLKKKTTYTETKTMQNQSQKDRSGVPHTKHVNRTDRNHTEHKQYVQRP